jgi:hypothetical protein
MAKLHAGEQTYLSERVKRTVCIWQVVVVVVVTFYLHWERTIKGAVRYRCGLLDGVLGVLFLNRDITGETSGEVSGGRRETSIYTYLRCMSLVEDISGFDELSARGQRTVASVFFFLFVYSSVGIFLILGLSGVEDLLFIPFPQGSSWLYTQPAVARCRLWTG